MLSQNIPDWFVPHHAPPGYLIVVAIGLLESLDETEILNPTATYERQRYVKLVILISHTDEIYENPTVFVEQRIYEDKQERAVVNELMFGTLVQLDLEYVFPGCGDEDRVLGKRDLVVRFQSVSYNRPACHCLERKHTSESGV